MRNKRLTRKKQQNQNEEQSQHCSAKVGASELSTQPSMTDAANKEKH